MMCLFLWRTCSMVNKSYSENPWISNVKTSNSNARLHLSRGVVVSWNFSAYLFLLLFVSFDITYCTEESSKSYRATLSTRNEATESCDKENCSSASNTISKTDWGGMAQNHFVTTLAGVQMPKLIYGTAWKKERTADLVVQAVRAGFRGIDTACQPKHYFESGVGAALKTLATEDDIQRESIFIQTKFTSISGQDPKNIPYDPQAELSLTVKQSLEVSLRNLGTTYIDSLVMHSPMRTHRDTMEVWRTFESFVKEGKVKQLGISNCYSLPNFQKIYEEATVKPAVLQNRLYGETGFDKELRQFCKEKGIFYQSFWTLTANPQILSNSEVRQIAQKYGKTTPQILFTYLIQTGVVTPLTGTTSVQHMKEDLETLHMTLTNEEMKVFDSFVN